jgi:hypothetical protein
VRAGVDLPPHTPSVRRNALIKGKWLLVIDSETTFCP